MQDIIHERDAVWLASGVGALSALLAQLHPEAFAFAAVAVATPRFARHSDWSLEYGALARQGNSWCTLQSTQSC